jgi:hypothetical protein
MTRGTTEAMMTISTLHTYHLHTTVALFHYLITSIYWNKGSEVMPRNLFSLVVRWQIVVSLNILLPTSHQIPCEFLVKLIGTKTTSNHCHRHGWPSLYSFEGKMTQPTKRATRILKRTFLGDFGNNNDQSFCNVHNHWY